MRGFRLEKWMAVCAFVVMFGCLAGSCLWVVLPISPHRGDGEFRDISHWAGPFRVMGYTVSMPDFDLEEAHDADYHLARLPNIGRECGVYMAIHDPNQSWFGKETRYLGGQLRLELLDARGNAVVSTNGKLGEYTWYGQYGWRPTDYRALYQLDQSFFRPSPDEDYRLHISYRPDPVLKGYKGCAFLRCGGNL